MRSFRPLLPLALLLAANACTGAQPSPQPGTPTPAATEQVRAPAADLCRDAPQAEKSYYEAQRLFHHKRYWEAAPTYVISFNFCSHPEVLCAAGHAYLKGGDCAKAVDWLDRCLGETALPTTARSAATRILAGARNCAAQPRKQKLSRGDEGELDGKPEPDDPMPWTDATFEQIRAGERR